MIIFILYQCAQLLLLPFFLPYTAIKNLYAQDPATIICESTGFVTPSDKAKNVIWIHGLSAGEISSAQELVNAIKRDIPNSACYITASTQEGKKTAQQQLACDYVSLLPHDDALAMSIAFDRINPKGIILLEHELKPTLMMLARLKSIPLYVLNAQYTAGTKSNLETFNFLYNPTLNLADLIFAQSDNDKTQLEAHGISPAKIVPIGNIKAYNALPKQRTSKQMLSDFLSQYMAKTNRAPILLVGSVHKGEIDHYINLLRELKPQFPELKMMIAPRFFDWKDELVSKVASTGLSYAVIDDPAQCPQSIPDLLREITDNILVKNDVLVVCLMGKLFYLHAITDLYFLGGTFVPVGGHNLLEPTAWGNPTLFGPHNQNTKDIADEVIAHNAGMLVTTEQELIAQTKRLLTDTQTRKEMSQRAAAWFENEAEHVTVNIQALLQDLKNKIAQ